jgi:hypothetical protein
MNKEIIGKVLISLLELASLGGGGFLIKDFFSKNNNNFNNNKVSVFPENTLAPVSSSKNKDTDSLNEYSCEKNGGDIVLNGKIKDIERPVMGFNTTIWGSNFPKDVRCNIVHTKLKKYNAHFITTGEKNGYSILCASNGPGTGCIKDVNNGQIVTLGRTGVNSQKALTKLLVSLNPNPGNLEASAGFLQTEARVYIDLDKMITEGNSYTTYVTEKESE